MDSSSSMEQMSRQFGRCLTQTTGNKTDDEAATENAFVKSGGTNISHFYSSPKRGLMSASTSAFTKPRSNDTMNRNDLAEVSFSPRGGNNSRSRSDRRPTDPTSNVMARHVASRLQRDAAAMMTKTTGGEPTPYHLRASPIARMRDNSFAATTTPASATGGARQSPKKEAKSYREVKQEKRLQWKKKMKIAQAKQRRERRALDEYTVESSTQFGGGNPIIGCVLDNVEGTNFFNRLAQCAGGGFHRDGGNASDSEYGSASSASEFYYSTEDDDSPDRRSSRKGRDGGRRQRGRSRGARKKRWDNNKSRESSTEERSSGGPSVDTTDPETSFLSADGTGDESKGGANLNKSISELNSLVTAKSGGRSSRSRSNSTEYALISPMDTSNNTSNIDFSPSPLRHPNTPSKHQLGASVYNESSLPLEGRSFVKMFIHDMEARGESMLWHQETSLMNPSNVTIRLRKGYRLPDGTYCAPRLIWTDLRRDQNYGFGIFDIRSLNHASIAHLHNFPYAIPGRSVLLHLKNSTSFIFEAGTEEDAVRLVRGLRSAIARLSYNLVIGNLDVSCELLDLGPGMEPKRKQRSGYLEFDWSRAMDDVTEQLIENAVSSTFEV